MFSISYNDIKDKISSMLSHKPESNDAVDIRDNLAELFSSIEVNTEIIKSYNESVTIGEKELVKELTSKGYSSKDIEKILSEFRKGYSEIEDLSRSFQKLADKFEKRGEIDNREAKTLVEYSEKMSSILQELPSNISADINLDNIYRKQAEFLVTDLPIEIRRNALSEIVSYLSESKSTDKNTLKFLSDISFNSNSSNEDFNAASNKLLEIADNTEENKTNISINKLIGKFDSSTKTSEQIKDTLEKQTTFGSSLKDAFLSRSSEISTAQVGKSLSQSMIASTLGPIGLIADQMFGISDRISGVGDVLGKKTSEFSKSILSSATNKIKSSLGFSTKSSDSKESNSELLASSEDIKSSIDKVSKQEKYDNKIDRRLQKRVDKKSLNQQEDIIDNLDDLEKLQKKEIKATKGIDVGGGGFASSFLGNIAGRSGIGKILGKIPGGKAVGSLLTKIPGIGGLLGGATTAATSAGSVLGGLGTAGATTAGTATLGAGTAAGGGILSSIGALALPAAAVAAAGAAGYGVGTLISKTTGSDKLGGKIYDLLHKKDDKAGIAGDADIQKYAATELSSAAADKYLKDFKVGGPTFKDMVKNKKLVYDNSKSLYVLPEEIEDSMVKESTTKAIKSTKSDIKNTNVDISDEYNKIDSIIKDNNIKKEELLKNNEYKTVTIDDDIIGSYEEKSFKDKKVQEEYDKLSLKNIELEKQKREQKSELFNKKIGLSDIKSLDKNSKDIATAKYALSKGYIKPNKDGSLDLVKAKASINKEIEDDLVKSVSIKKVKEPIIDKVERKSTSELINSKRYDQVTKDLNKAKEIQINNIPMQPNSSQSIKPNAATKNPAPSPIVMDDLGLIMVNSGLL